MRDQKIVPVILAGGKGTRLWPLSRSQRPKQFISLVSEQSLFQQTLERICDQTRYSLPIIVTNLEYEFLVREQAASCGMEIGSIILEPFARNTAPAVTAAALIAQQRGHRLMHVMPADHQISTGSEYEHALELALNSALNGDLVTFGIQPTRPATSYGYIEASPTGFQEAPAISRFIEKPDAQTAEELLRSRDVLWNSGMFLFEPKSLLEECLLLAPDVYHPVLEAVEKATNQNQSVKLDPDAFGKTADISIDYAIFEKTLKARVVPACFHWSDVGSWDSVWKEGGSDSQGNVAKGPVRLHDTSNSLVVSDGIHVAVNGVDNLTIIASEDVLYVGNISASQNIGQIVKSLAGTPETAILVEKHRTELRPWGGFTQLMLGERFQVKRLSVDPGKKLSLQKHHHRSEHWIVVRGVAEVTCGNDVLMVHEGQSTYIPLGAMHRIHNPGKIQLELIEVQTGSYLGEDDIIRFDDDFGRATQTANPSTDLL